MSVFFVLSKILHFLTTPIVWIAALFLLGLLARKPARRKRRLIASFILFYFFSNAFIYEEFVRPYEVPLGIAENVDDDYEAVVVLGGYGEYIPNFDQFNLFETSDRLFQAVRLYKMGKANKIFLVGGTGRLVDRDNRESTHARNLLIQMGIPTEDIMIEPESNNTRENAVRATQILRLEGMKKCLLITSASHIPRSIACFEKLGYSMDSYAVDATAGPRRAHLDYLLVPDSDILKKWDAIAHEWIGYATYMIMGYV